MFRKLLIPLDGSRRAEAALPAAAAIARRNGASLILLHLIEEAAPPAVHGDRHITAPVEAADYLQATGTQLRATGLNVTAHVHAGKESNVAQGIADHLLELGADAVVMSTHADGALHNLLFGNMAQQVVGKCGLPVLLVRPAPQAGVAVSFDIRRVLIPHDGVPEHEPALKTGAALARIFGAETRLMIAIPTPTTVGGPGALAGQLMPGATRAMLAMEAQAGAEHLSAHVRELEAGGLSVSAVALHGRPAECIQQAAEEFQADAIVLGTHGHAGTRAFWEGSVAAAVALRTSTSLLLVPVGKNPVSAGLILRH